MPLRPRPDSPRLAAGAPGLTAPPAPARYLPAHRSRVHAIRSLIVALAALAICTLTAIPHGVSGPEERVFRAINDLPGWLEWVLWAPMQLGTVVMVPAAGLVAFLVWRRRRPALDLAVAGSVAWVAAKVIKASVGRGRPAALLGNVRLRGSFGVSNRTGLGFPSGHATVAFALAAAAYPWLTPRLRATVLSLAAVVALSRLYFGAHLPLDVVGGTALGVTIGATVHLLADTAAARSRLSDDAAPAP
jgi:membrane-associated phospholipid phosphatase